MLTTKNKYLLLLILSIIWGSSFILMKRGLVGLTPFQLGSLRIIFAGIFVLTIGFKKLEKITLHQFKYIALTALLSTLMPIYLFAFAQTKISSSVSSILNSLTPINTILLGALMFYSSINKMQILGVFFGFIGSVFLILENLLANPEQNNIYGLFIITATFCYAFGINILSNKLNGLSPMSIAVASFSLVLLPAILILSFTGFWGSFNNPQVLSSIPYVIVLGVIGTGMANILFFRLIQISGPIFASTVTYLVPAVAIIWGIIDGEKIDYLQFIGAFIILFGVYLSSKKT